MNESTITHNTIVCEFCENGEVWGDCCNGTKSCACKGMQVFFGQCRVCNGTGKRAVNADTKANFRAIQRHAAMTGGYLGNPHGRLR